MTNIIRSKPKLYFNDANIGKRANSIYCFFVLLQPRFLDKNQ